MTTLSMPIPATFAARTDVGLQRDVNQDRYLAAPPLYAVADGLGGRNAGETAAQLLVDELPAAVGAGVGPEALVRACERINRRIATAAEAQPGRKGMSTTCVVLQFADGLAHVAHVGDSRAYLLRQQTLTRLTDDHTVVGDLVRSGSLTPDQAEVHDRRHVLTQALGAAERVDVATTTVRVEVGDRFLLCSDGLSGQVRDEVIAETLIGNGASPLAADALVALANGAGGADNVTVLIVDADGSLATPAAGPAGGARTADHGGMRRWAVLLVLSVLVGVGLLAGFLVGGRIGTAPAPSAPPAATALPSAGPVATPGEATIAPTTGEPIPGAEGAPSEAAP